MPRWILPVALSVLGAVAVGLAWLLRTKQGARVRRRLMKQEQLMRRQGERTFDQVSRQVQGGAQDLLDQGRRLVDKVTR